ncbi:MAG: hypothetical protein ABII23_01690 [bacterium]
MKISKKKLLQRLGHNFSRGSITDAVNRRIDDALLAAQKLIKPVHIIRADKIISNTGDAVLLSSGYEIHSTHISSLLKNCHTAYGFAVTIAKALEEKRDVCHTENDTVNALIFDAIGSVAVEEYAHTVQQQIKQIASAHHQRITRRFSPGYGDWHLENQKSFLDWLEAEKIHIHVSSAHIMFPEKSISAILGVTDGNKN